MVGLARELQEEPFHLVLSHNQRGSAEDAVIEAYDNGLEIFQRGVSITKFGRHPGIEGTGYVPYYALFGPRGELVDHHQGGPYHGGNGNAVLESVRALVAELPDMDLGTETFEDFAPLAERLAAEDQRRAALSELSRNVKRDPGHRELRRMALAVDRWIRREVTNAAYLMVRQPEQALRQLQALHATVLRSSWAQSTGKAIGLVADVGADSPLRAKVRDDQRAAAKAFREVEQAWLALEPLPGHGGLVRNPFSATFLGKHELRLQELRGDLERLHRDFPGSFTAEVALAFRDLLDFDSHDLGAGPR